MVVAGGWGAGGGGMAGRPGGGGGGLWKFPYLFNTHPHNTLSDSCLVLCHHTMSGLVWAVKNGDLDQVKELVEQKVCLQINLISLPLLLSNLCPLPLSNLCPPLLSDPCLSFCLIRIFPVVWSISFLLSDPFRFLLSDQWSLSSPVLSGPFPFLIFTLISPVVRSFFFSCWLIQFLVFGLYLLLVFWWSISSPLTLTSPVVWSIFFSCFLSNPFRFLQCSGSMTFWCGSGSGSADPCLWLMDPDPDPAIFVIDLQDASKN